MGYGGWNANSYASTASKLASGTTFAYDRGTRSKGRDAWKAHPNLDPKKVAGPASPFAGQVMRESRDNADTANSLPISVFFDGTGSMGDIPYQIQKKLGDLFNLIMLQGYAEDPQVMIGCYGDGAAGDRVPLQVSEWESDARIAENLDNLFIERGGGGNGYEQAALALYFMAAHTATDAWDKRKKKGYVFIIGDETTRDLTPYDVESVFGDGEPLAPLKLKELVPVVQERYEVFFLLVNNGSAKMQGSEAHYKKLLGETNVLVMENMDSVAETIAVAIGVAEGTVDLDDAADDLKSTGSNEVAVRTAVNAVSNAGLAGFSRGTVVKGNADFGISPTAGDDGRL